MTEIIRLNQTACDEDELEKNGIEFAVYDYYCEGYEGYGNCLMYKEGKWYTCDMGHCSCYGPFDDLNLDKPYDSVEEAISVLDDEDWSKSFDKSIETIKALGIKWKTGSMGDSWYLIRKIEEIGKKLRSLDGRYINMMFESIERRLQDLEEE